MFAKFATVNFLFFFSGRKIAIDASMCLYQFLIAVRAEGAQLTSADGETTRLHKFALILKLYFFMKKIVIKYFFMLKIVT